MRNTLKTTKKVIDRTLTDKIKLINSLWDNDFLDEDQINDITKLICGRMTLDGLCPQDQILPFAEYLDGDFDRDYDEENDEDPHWYGTITEYLNCESLVGLAQRAGVVFSSSLKTDADVRARIYELWFNYNGYFKK